MNWRFDFSSACLSESTFLMPILFLLMYVNMKPNCMHWRQMTWTLAIDFLENVGFVFSLLHFMEIQLCWKEVKANRHKTNFFTQIEAHYLCLQWDWCVRQIESVVWNSLRFGSIRFNLICVSYHPQIKSYQNFTFLAQF